jgi:hypothetical protein
LLAFLSKKKKKKKKKKKLVVFLDCACHPCSGASDNDFSTRTMPMPMLKQAGMTGFDAARRPSRYTVLLANARGRRRTDGRRESATRQSISAIHH